MTSDDLFEAAEHILLQEGRGLDDRNTAITSRMAFDRLRAAFDAERARRSRQALTDQKPHGEGRSVESLRAANLRAINAKMARDVDRLRSERDAQDRRADAIVTTYVNALREVGTQRDATLAQLHAEVQAHAKTHHRLEDMDAERDDLRERLARSRR